MSLPTMHGLGRLTAATELRFAKSGTAVCTVPLAFNARRKNERGEWEDDGSFFIRGRLFGDAAENAAESYGKGDEVVVSGRLKTDQWQDKNTGDKRTAPSLLIDAIGPSTRSAKAQISKTTPPDRSGSSWPETAQTSALSGATDEPPF